MIREDIKRNYDRVLYNQNKYDVLFVVKDKKYGVVDKDGNVIVPCMFSTYNEAHYELEKVIPFRSSLPMTLEDSIKKKYENGLTIAHNELVSSGDIKSITFYEERVITGAELVKLSDGSIGIAAAVSFYEHERGNNIEIKNNNGEHVMFLSEPELFHKGETPGSVICRDRDYLYVGTYNTNYAYIACYRMGDFERVWKTKLYGSAIQSITVNDNELIVFDMKDGGIKYFNKINGERIYNKGISTKDVGDIAHHELTSTNERLLTNIPGIRFGLSYLENVIQIFDNDTGKELASGKSNVDEVLKTMTYDEINKEVFMGFKEKIVVFGEEGYKGYFQTPYEKIHKLDIDKETGNLLVSMYDGYNGKVEVYNRKAIERLLYTSRILKSQLKDSYNKLLMDDFSDDDQDVFGK